MHYARFFAVLASNMEILVSRGGYPLLFLVVLLEGLPLIGLAVPGHVAIIAAGFLAKVGLFSLPVVIVISAVAAVSGDFIGFMIGRRYGYRFLDRVRPYLFVTETHIAKARALLSKHTGKALIIGRFTPATRALMPFLVGASEIKAGKFWLYNLIGGLSWSVLSVLFGYVIGSAYGGVSAYFGKAVFAALIVSALIAWGYRFANERFHLFRRYELFTLILNVVSLVGLAAVIESLFERPFRLGFDVWVNLLMSRLNGAWPLLVALAKGISAFGEFWPAALSVFFGLALVARHKWRSGTILLLSISLTAAAVGTMKEFFQSPRPMDALVLLPGDPGFPSGHAALAACFFFAAAYLLAPKIHSRTKREWMFIIFFLFTVLIGLSRLVLNVHWASDVIAGWFLGLFLSTASVLFVRYAGALLAGKGHSRIMSL